MASATSLMTVAEFRQLPEPVGDFQYELHHGELARATRPKHKHIDMQHDMQSLMAKLLGKGWKVGIELPFRAVLEHDLRAADVCALPLARWNNIDPEDNLRGAPDLVVEILSPLNTASEMYDREQLCLENGAKEFWTVDLDRRHIRVASTDRPAQIYRQGQEVPLPAFGGGSLTVNDVFSELP
jgi:Uma2 family endonuclease